MLRPMCSEGLFHKHLSIQTLLKGHGLLEDESCLEFTYSLLLSSSLCKKLENPGLEFATK